MKKIISLILFFILISNISNIVFASRRSEETITLTQFIDVQKQDVTGVQIYTLGYNYGVGIDDFFEIADKCIITPSSEPRPISSDGLYIGVMTKDSVICPYISNDGGIDRAVPASGRQLEAFYTLLDVSYIDKIISLLHEIPLSSLIESEKEEIEKICMYSPVTGTESEYSGESSLETFFTTENINEVRELFETVRPITYASNVEIVSDWAKEYISKAREKGIISNNSDNFTEAITREEFCEFVYNLILCVNGHITLPDDKIQLTDTDNPKVHSLNRAGIIKGKSETDFAPYDYLNREEAAAIVVRMINIEMPMAVTEMLFEFDDTEEISEWASDSVQIICNLGFMLGINQNKFAPKDIYTAEQAIATLVRIYETVRKIYTYETPLGTIQTETNCDSHINFAIQCNAKINLIKDATNFKDTHFIIETPVKALTNQTSSMTISFDDFARIFDGKWKLIEGTFEFIYDPTHKTEMVKSLQFSDGTDGEWPNKTEAVDVITFSDINTITVNGEALQIKAQYGGKVYNSHITMYNGILYIPVQMVAELLDFDIAALQVIL